ncbi:Uncharacterized membrane protein [Clostridium cavendishii DSM 21758]|uniref:Uncharacterized membrane protein n=1 Tax=Clostridium cavendishii DSM 21758 TaxID=1121302 RepID=A0A1M6U636_9CLOT|nr:DUF4870 domain-containing protein [Clostridium cavendishii]SHK64634.1 Uncharacterized membrane protein [Clostridium cavendishii DSM 21758]
MDNNLGLKAFLCYFFSLIGGAVIFFIEKENLTLKFHGAQAMAFGILYAICSTILGFIDFPLISIFRLALFILYILVVIKGVSTACKNEMYRMPVLAEIADKIMETLK